MENNTMPHCAETFVPLAKMKEFMGKDFFAPSFSRQITDSLTSLREDLLKKIVKMGLGKDVFELSEVGRFSFIGFEHLPQREFIGLDDEVIGEMAMFQKEENFQWKMGFEFHPGKMVMKNGCLQFVPKPELK